MPGRRGLPGEEVYSELLFCGWEVMVQSIRARCVLGLRIMMFSRLGELYDTNVLDQKVSPTRLNLDSSLILTSHSV